jgi:hypothetical protein
MGVDKIRELWYIYFVLVHLTMTTSATADQQLARLGFEILENLFRPAADEAAEGFFVSPEAYEVAPTQDGELASPS